MIVKLHKTHTNVSPIIPYVNKHKCNEFYTIKFRYEDSFVIVVESSLSLPDNFVTTRSVDCPIDGNLQEARVCDFSD